MERLQSATALARPVETDGRLNANLYVNRELSWIEFDRRVLEEARNPAHPLLERVKFAAIFHSNLDEFFMIRVSGIKESIDAGVLTERSLDGRTPVEQLDAIREQLLPMVADCQRLVASLNRELSQAGIDLLRHDQLDEAQQGSLRAFFEEQVFPVLTPLAVDPTHPFPFISSLSVNLLAVLDADHGSRTLYARIKVPETLPRLVPVPPSAAQLARHPGCKVFVWLEDLIAANVQQLFPGERVLETFAFRVTRDADMEVSDTAATNLLSQMERLLQDRHFGPPIRLEIPAAASAAASAWLIRNLDVDPQDIYTVDGAVGVRALMALYGLDRPDLKDEPLVPALPPVLRGGGDLFAAIRQRDLLLQHPYHAFTPIIDLVRTAARDPDVLAIKQTLYRIERDSPLVRALIDAREQGKQVAVLVELKARFDEKNNIEWAKSLERTGIHVAYGVVGLKTHAKLLMVVRREPDGIRRYVHLGTGNYNASTARLYTDFSLFTCDPQIGEDVGALFNVLTGFSRRTGYDKLLVAPEGLYPALLRCIDAEVARHAQHGDGHIVFKCNSLTEPGVISALYRASQAGVRIDLIVRGTCCLRPGLPGVSETIRVRSVVGRFLEHHRLYYFRNGEQPLLYLASADLMDRNLHRRVEVAFPIGDPRLLTWLRDTFLDAYLRDNTQTRFMSSDGSYQRPLSEGHEPVNAQVLMAGQLDIGG